MSLQQARSGSFLSVGHHSCSSQGRALAAALVHTLCYIPPESFKIQYLQFLAYTKTPQYKANLQQLLDQEKVCGLHLNVVVGLGLPGGF